MKSKSTVRNFWDKEYDDPKHLALSSAPSGDLVDFEKWYMREFGDDVFSVVRSLDIGCGNGRNIIHLAEEYGTKGVGFDSSEVAIREAKKNAPKSGIDFLVRDLKGPLPAEDGSIGLALDLMASHVLNEKERQVYLGELVRVLDSNGVVLWKSFLKDGDSHSKELIAKHGVKGDKDAYEHPMHGGYEHVWSESDFKEFVEPYFSVEVFKRSHGHRGQDGVARKRRYFVAYLVKK